MSKQYDPIWYKRIMRKLFGDRVYQNVHAMRAFQSMSSPFPSQASPPEEVDWSKGLTDRSGYTGLAYIVSPIQRSGTNYLNFMMGNHPDLRIPTGPEYPQEQCLYSAASELAAYAAQTVGYWTNWVTEPEERQAQARKMLADMGESVLTQFKVEGEDKMMLFKTPDSGNVFWAYHLFPSVKLIVLVRDGRDAVTSYIHSWGGESIFRRLCKRWQARMQEIFELEAFVGKNGLEHQYCLVRYEDLLHNTENELRRIFGFLQLDPEVYPWESLDSVPVLGSSSLKKGDEVHWKPVKKPKSFNPTGKWHDWNRFEKSVFKKYAGDTLIRLGYAKDKSW